MSLKGMQNDILIQIRKRIKKCHNDIFIFLYYIILFIDHIKYTSTFVIFLKSRNYHGGKFKKNIFIIKYIL